MNEEGDIPSVSEVIQTAPMESLSEDPAEKIDNAHENGEKKPWIFGRFPSFRKKSKDELAKTIMELQDKLEFLQLKCLNCIQLQEEVKSTSGKIAHLERENSQLELLQFKSDTFEKEAERYKRELDDAKEKSEIESRELNDYIQAERNKNSHLTKRFEESKSLVTQLQDEEKSTLSKIADLERELGNVKVKSEAESNKLDDCIQAERNQNSHLAKENEESKSLITQLQEEAKSTSTKIAHLERELHDAKVKSESASNKLNYENSHLAKELEESKSLVIQLQEEAKSTSVKITHLERELSQLELLQFKSDTFEKEAERCKRELDEANVKLDELNYESSHLTKELDGSKTLIIQLQEEANSKSAKIAHLERELDDAKVKSESESNRLNDENSHLSKDLEGSKALITQLQDEEKSTLAKIVDLERELDDAKVKSESESNRLNDENSHLSKELDGSKSLITQLQEEANSTSAKIAHLERERDDAKVKSESESNRLNDENSHLSKELDGSKALVTQLQEEGKSSLANIADLERELDNVKVKSEAQSNKLKKYIQAERNKNSHLTKRLNISKSLITSLRRKVKSSSVKIAHLEEKGKISTELAKTSERISEELEKIIGRQDTISRNVGSILDRPDFAIRARFTEISKLGTDRVYSRPVTFAGGEWKIFVYKNDGHLAFFLGLSKANDTMIQFSAVVRYQLISQIDGSIKRDRNSTKNKPELYDLNTGTSWGYDMFISFEDLFNEENGFVEDDSILVACVLKVFPTHPH